MGSIASALTGSGANKAAKAQAASAEQAMIMQKQALVDSLALGREALALQEKQFQQALALGEPYRAAGSQALAQYESLLYGVPIEQTSTYLSMKKSQDAANAPKPAAKTYDQLKAMLPATAVPINGSMTPSYSGAQFANKKGPERWKIENGKIYVQYGQGGGVFSAWQPMDTGEAAPAAPQEALPVTPTGTLSDIERIRNEALIKSPSYQFRLDEGQKAVERSAAARSGALSGAAVKATERFAQNLASTEFGTFMDRIAGVAGQGAAAAGAGANQAIQTGANQAGVLGQMSGSTMEAGNNVGSLLMQQGAARASGYLSKQQAGQNLLNMGGQALGFASGAGWI